jgi:hypothetical protein
VPAAGGSRVIESLTRVVLAQHFAAGKSFRLHIDPTKFHTRDGELFGMLGRKPLKHVYHFGAHDYSKHPRAARVKELTKRHEENAKSAKGKLGAGRRMACVRACVRARVRARVCVRACVRGWVGACVRSKSAEH